MSQQDCSSAGFRALLATQFLSALNDNLFKLILTLYTARDFVYGSGGIGHLILVSVVFISPYVFCSTLAGWLADRFAKDRIVKVMKAVEILIMVAALGALHLEHLPSMLFVLCCMGAQSALFSPAKYGLLPEILEPKELSKGNGLIEFATFTGIIAGTALGGVVVQFFGTTSYATGLILVGFAVLGTITSLGVPRTSPGRPAAPLELNPLRAVGTIGELRQHRGLFQSVVGIAYFWAIGSMYQLNLVLYGKAMLAASEVKISLMLAIMGVGIGCGSVVAGKVSEGKVELGLVPLGALGLATSSVLLSVSYNSYSVSVLLLAVMGFCSGFFIVPLNAYLQEMSPPERLGQYLAASNFVSFCSMLVFSGVLLVVIDGIGINPAQLFLVFGLSTIVVAIYICTVLPEVLLRCLNWCFIHFFYRVAIQGAERVPKQGGALLVCNHVSMLDAQLVLASLHRPVRFLIYRPIYESKFVNPVAKIMGAIPVEGGAKKEEVEHALRGASDAIAAGELVCIFAEGAITRTGHLLKFKRGFERIMSAVDAPIVPVHLDQVWGSIFSFKHGKFFWKWPKSIPYRVTISFGEPRSAKATSAEVRQAVQELSVEAFRRRPAIQNSLPRVFLQTAKARGPRRCASDQDGRAVTWWGALHRSLVLFVGLRKLQRNPGGTTIGFFLPPSVDLALLNVAAHFAGGVSVNFDLSGTFDESSLEVLLVRIRQAGVTCVVAPERVANLLTEAMPGIDIISLESLLKAVSPGASVLLRATVVCLPLRLLIRLYDLKIGKAEDSAAVVFSRGSSGAPKAVLLSHQNIVSNVSALQELFGFDSSDSVLGVMPCSHAFGLSATIWMPLLTGTPVVFAATPDDIASIERVVASSKPTILYSTRQFLENLISKGDPVRLSSLEYVFVGGDPVGAELRERCAAVLKAQILEGYGSVELSPLAVINVPDGGDGREAQIGSKFGTAGHPIPGVAVKVVDPATNAMQAPGFPGRLLVKGPNVLKGYLYEDGLRSPTLDDGWFDTGDTAMIDADGFIKLTGRNLGSK